MFNKTMAGLWRWNLFWWKVEGMEPLNGLNVYHNDPDSAGFVIRVGARGFKCRYSKRAKRWVVKFQKYSWTPETKTNSWSLNPAGNLEIYSRNGIRSVADHEESRSGI